MKLPDSIDPLFRHKCLCSMKKFLQKRLEICHIFGIRKPNMQCILFPFLWLINMKWKILSMFLQLQNYGKSWSIPWLDGWNNSAGISLFFLQSGSCGNIEPFKKMTAKNECFDPTECWLLSAPFRNAALRLIGICRT